MLDIFFLYDSCNTVRQGGNLIIRGLLLSFQGVSLMRSSTPKVKGCLRIRWIHVRPVTVWETVLLVFCKIASFTSMAVRQCSINADPHVVLRDTIVVSRTRLCRTLFFGKQHISKERWILLLEMTGIALYELFRKWAFGVLLCPLHQPV